MPSEAYKTIQSNVAETLRSSTINKCSRWVQKVRVIGEPPAPYSFEYYPYLKQIHDDNSPEIVIMKGAQLGFTEYALNRTLFVLDQLKLNVLYALPNERPDAMGFSKARLNPAADLSPYINNLFTISKGEGLKITRDSKALYIRGARSRICFKQIDVGLVVLDELDEMTDEAVNLARYRLAGQRAYRQLLMLSTPSIEGKGIHKQYMDTNQYHFFFPCPSCDRRVELTYPNSLVVAGEDITDPRVSESYLRCPECHTKIDHNEKHKYFARGEWVAAYPDRPVHGYHINQLYSPALGSTPEELAKQALRAKFDVVAKTEFYNSSLGLTFIAEGAKITDQMINDLQRDYFNGDIKGVLSTTPGHAPYRVTIGCDVGQEKHYVAVMGWKFDSSTRNTRDITEAAVGRLLYYGEIDNLKDLIEIMNRWRPIKVVIDAQPEAKLAHEIAKQYSGCAYTCYYSLSKAGKQIQMGNVKECSISVNRTFWIDALFNKFRTHTMELPRDITLDIREHLKALVKVYKRDDDGGTYSEYVKKESAPDHFAHAMTYATIGLGLTAGHGGNETY